MSFVIDNILLYFLEKNYIVGINITWRSISMYDKKINNLKSNKTPESLGILIGNQAYLSLKSKERPTIQRQLIIDGFQFDDEDELTALFSAVPPDMTSIIRELYSFNETFHFENKSKMLEYARKVQAHIASMQSICATKEYNKELANRYMYGHSKRSPISSGNQLNCWTAVTKAALDAELDTKDNLLSYCKAQDREISEDPYLVLMSNASEYDCTDKSPDEIISFLNTIPTGHIVAFDSNDRTRNTHVFISTGGGNAIEFDENNKGITTMQAIYTRYSGMSILKIYYCRSPWLQGISTYDPEQTT